jgi:hypothetical protein
LYGFILKVKNNFVAMVKFLAREKEEENFPLTKTG